MMLCTAPSAHSGDDMESEPASTTEPEAPAEKMLPSLKANDPYPTWPFTQVEPRSLSRWCKKHLQSTYQIEEALF